MKVLLVLVLLASLSCVFAQIPAQLNQALSVNSTAKTYSFFSLPPLTSAFTLVVSSPNAGAASTVTIGSYVNLPVGFSLPSGGVSANSGLPAGYLPFSASLSPFIGAAMSINFTADIDGSASATVNIPASVFGATNTTLYTAFRPLYFSASAGAYYELPTNQYNITLNGGITIFTSGSLIVTFAIRSPAPLGVSIANNAIVYANLVANTAATFAISEASGAALYIYNLTAASAGSVTIRVSANSASQAGQVSASGNILVSNIYSFNHSAGSTVSATLSYNIGASGKNFNSSIIADSDWYWYNNGRWEEQDSSVSGGVVVYTTNHFSDWSVQSDPDHSGGAGSTLEAPMFAKLLKFLF